ncbi:MAG TPA: hypothetical protein VFO18_02770 [Methylomirabilota bacterium]|nr:hypothetical protein [Methylomirabilota bacterium]
MSLTTALDADGAAGMWLMALLIVGLGAIVAAKAVELKRKRAGQTLALEGRLWDLLVADPTVSGLPVRPSVRLPFWRGTPVLVVLKGQVPTPHLRDAVREVVRREMAIVPGGYYLDDRLVVVGRSPIRHAA